MRTGEAVKYLKDNLDSENISIAIVLGSGLSFLEDEMDGATHVKTSGIPNYPRSTVMGHKGTITAGSYKGKKIMILAGRVHYYEGYTYVQVVFPVDILAGLGVKKLLLTNAAGGINKNFGPGTMVALERYIAPFSPMYKEPVTEPYSKELNGLLKNAAQRTNNRIENGCYAYMTGPSFETKAEIKYLGLLGADTVGMSTVPETVRAKELGLEAACISRVSNFAAGLTGEPLSHTEVLEAAKSSQEGFISLLKEFVSLL